ncbi:centromere protein ZW10 [Cryptosporidium ubiquitum]|uniref:Centromere protein ZW10 n=1 Tax=Cryptosporidium ubiquitum TaxID=857276 RepID=A0A1J4MNX2_9CRYT|nr:centromere protein ZW10 [Cryptosporidium ubiquitum]OII74716.1 centromere protein ZW10 [Cryptosporidium ubiquitum]
MDDLLSSIKVKMLTEAHSENSSISFAESIRKLLGTVEDELRSVRESVLESIDVSSINYVKSKKELDSLQTEAVALRKTIASIETKVEEDLESSKGAAEIEEISSIKRELATLKKASVFFETIAQLHSVFAEFDNYLVEYEFDLAADALSNASQKLNEINFDDSDINQIGSENITGNRAIQRIEEEKDVFEEVKIEYLHRRGRLVSIVELLFRYIFHLERNEIRIRMSLPRSLLMEISDFNVGFDSKDSCSTDDGDEIRVSLQDVWYSLISVGVVNEHVAYLSKLCIDNILDPLVSKSSKLSAEKNCGYKLLPSETRSHNEYKWEYKVVSSKSNDKYMDSDGTEGVDSQLSVYEHAVPVLISLLKFLSEDCFTGNIQVISLFGKYTWNWISPRLLHGISSTPSTKDCQILREFEVQARSLQIIPAGEDTISNYVNQLETSRYEERKIHALSFAREIIMRDDPSIILVDDSTEIGSLTNLLQQCGVEKSKADKNNDLSNLINLIGEGDLIGSMEIGSFSSIQYENESFLQLQICGVSSCAHSLIQKVHQILDEALLDAQKHCLSSAKQGYFLVRELVMLFILLRPTIHKERLNDPLFTATFYTDCTYLIHHLILIPFTYGSKFPPPIPQVGSFVDLLLTLRKLQETAISSLLTKESASIRELLEEKALSMESMKNMSMDQTFIEVETIIVDIVQRLKRVSSMFSSTLPIQIYLQSFGILVDETISTTLNQVLKLATSDDVKDVSPDDASALVLLLNNLASQIQRLFECHIFKVNPKDGSASNFGVHNSRLIYNDPPSLVGYLKYWDSLTVLRDTLDADIASIVQQKHKLKTLFKYDEIRGILNLNPFLSSNVDEVYYIIISSE